MEYKGDGYTGAKDCRARLGGCAARGHGRKEIRN